MIRERDLRVFACAKGRVYLVLSEGPRWKGLWLLPPAKHEGKALVNFSYIVTRHRIRLEVSSSNFPRFDRNPNSGKPFGTDTELLSAKQTLLHDRDHVSHLVLPVIPR